MQHIAITANRRPKPEIITLKSADKAIDFENADINAILDERNLSRDIFSPDHHTLTLDDSLDKHVAWVNQHIYSVPYSEGHVRNIHGIQHVTRVAIYIPVLYQLYNKYDESQSLTEDQIRLVQIAALFHDAGRIADGVDLWEEQSAILLYHYLTKKLNVNAQEAEQLAYAVARGEPEKPWSLSTKLLHDADSLDIRRVRSKEKYDYAYLAFYRDHGYTNAQAKEDMLQLVSDVENWLTLQGDECGHHNSEIKQKYAGDDAYEKMMLQLEKHKNEFKALKPDANTQKEVNDRRIKKQYLKLVAAVNLLPYGESNVQLNQCHQALRNALPEFTTAERALQDVATFAEIVNQNKMLYRNYPDYYLLKCIGHLVASLLTLGAYAVVKAKHSYQIRQTYQFWKPAQHIFMSRIEQPLLSITIDAINKR